MPLDRAVDNIEITPQQQIEDLHRQLYEEQQKNEQLMAKTYHDPLTGLHNRSFWEEYLQNFDKHRGLAIVMSVDLDNLKIVNDRHGHNAGDNLLKGVAAVLKEAVRPEDLVARLGGDEFGILILLPEDALIELSPGIDLVQVLTDRIRQKQQQYNKNHDTEIPVEFSIGGQLSLKPPHSFKQFFEQADKQMYTNKSNRKNATPDYSI